MQYCCRCECPQNSKDRLKNKIHYWIFSKKDLFQRFISSFNCLRTEFSPEFLTILISTKRAVYDGGQDVRYKLKGQCHKIFFLTHRKTKEKFYLSFLNSQLVSSVIEHSTSTYLLGGDSTARPGDPAIKHEKSS